MDRRPCFDDQLAFIVHSLMHTKTPDGEAEGSAFIILSGVKESACKSYCIRWMMIGEESTKQLHLSYLPLDKEQILSIQRFQWRITIVQAHLHIS